MSIACLEHILCHFHAKVSHVVLKELYNRKWHYQRVLWDELLLVRFSLVHPMECDVLGTDVKMVYKWIYNMEKIMLSSLSTTRNRTIDSMTKAKVCHWISVVITMKSYLRWYLKVNHSDKWIHWYVRISRDDYPPWYNWKREERERKRTQIQIIWKRESDRFLFFLYYNTLEIGSNYVFIEQRLFMTDKFERLTLVWMDLIKVFGKRNWTVGQYRARSWTTGALLHCWVFKS